MQASLVVISADHTALCLVKQAIFTGQHNDGRCFVVGIVFDQCAGLIAIETGHHDVDKNNVWFDIDDFRERVKTV